MLGSRTTSPGRRGRKRPGSDLDPQDKRPRQGEDGTVSNSDTEGEGKDKSQDRTPRRRESPSSQDRQPQEFRQNKEDINQTLNTSNNEESLASNNPTPKPGAQSKKAETEASPNAQEQDLQRKQNELKEAWAKKTENQIKPTEQEIVEKDLKFTIDWSTAVLGTDLSYPNSNLVLNKVQQLGNEQNGTGLQRPAYMTGFLYLRGKNWDTSENTEFLNQIAKNRSSVHVEHQKIVQNLKSNPNITGTELLKKLKRKENQFGTPEEVAYLIDQERYKWDDNQLKPPPASVE